MIFVALEGIDNCGKTTLSKELCKKLKEKKINVFCSRELVETDVGKIVLKSFQKNIKLSSEEKTLYFALDRLQRHQDIIQKDYDVVVWDRYVYSALVYREMEGYDITRVKNINTIFKTPELNVYMDIEISLAMKRARENKRILPYSKKELTRCKDIYLRYVKEKKMTEYLGFDWLVAEIERLVSERK